MVQPMTGQVSQLPQLRGNVSCYRLYGGNVTVTIERNSQQAWLT